MYFDRFDVCEAYFVLEMYYNDGGWLQERPSNQRRNESCGVQLHRISFRPSPMLDYESLSDNGKAIFHDAIERLGLPAWEDEQETSHD